MGKTQPVNTLYDITHEDEEIRISLEKLPTPKASSKLFGQSPVNRAKSTSTYHAPAPIVQIHTQFMMPPHYLQMESAKLSPEYQKKLNEAESKIASPLPIVNQGGVHTTYDKRLENRIIYDPPFNLTGLMSVPMILLTLILFSVLFVKRN